MPFDIRDIIRNNENLSDKTIYKKYTDPGVLDAEWLSDSLHASNEDVASGTRKHRFSTTASNKLTDTSYGGHFSMNPKPQYSRYCDIRHKRNRLSSKFKNKPMTVFADKGKLSFNTSHGMGRYYSEA